MNTFSEVWRKLSNRKYRAAFARTQFKRLVPLQIQTLRKQRGWSQEVLAENAQLTQGVISRAEDQDYGNLTVNTILSIAEGLDVAFVGRFVPFSELNRWYVNLSRETMQAPSFDEENAVMIAAEDEQNAGLAEKEELSGATKADKRFGNVISIDKARDEIVGKGQTVPPVLLCAPPTKLSEGGLAHAAVGGSTR